MGKVCEDVSKNGSQPASRPTSGNSSPTPTVRMYSCLHHNCTKRFPTVCRLIRHFRVHGRIFPYRCTTCPYKCCFKGSLIKHIRTMHFHLPATLCEQEAPGIVNKEDPRVNLIVDEEQLQMEQQLLNCAFRFPFMTTGGSRRNANHNGEVSDEEDDSENDYDDSEPDSESNSVELLTQRQRKYCCCFRSCCAVFAQISHLYEHTRRHTGYRLFRCSFVDSTQLCGEEFAKKSHVTAHIRTHHWKLPATKGEQLERGIVDDRNANVFIEFNESLFEEEMQLILKMMADNLWIVHKEDEETLSLEEEEDSETDYEPESVEEDKVESNFESESCKFRMSQSRAQARRGQENKLHQRKQKYLCKDSATSAEESECEGEMQAEADETSLLEATFSKHKLCPFPHCGRSFSFRSYLRNHFCVHFKVQPFRCRICEKTFNLKSNANKHIRLYHLKPPQKSPLKHLQVLKAELKKVNDKLESMSRERGGAEKNIWKMNAPKKI